MEDEEYFTVVFKGNIRKLERSPFKTETVFGTVVACGVGNAYDEVLALTIELGELLNDAEGTLQ